VLMDFVDGYAFSQEEHGIMSQVVTAIVLLVSLCVVPSSG